MPFRRRILRRELEARGWNQKDLAEILGRPAQAITEIIRGTKQITPETAVALAAAFDTSAEFWSNLESRYRPALAQQTASTTDEVSRKARLYDWVPVGELLKRGWILAGESVEDLERAVCSFLGVAKIGDDPVLVVNLRHSSKDGSEKAAQRAWVRRVEQLVAAQQVGPFDAARLRHEIPSLLAEAATVEGVGRVPGRLRDLGVRFVVVPHLPRTRLDGVAAFTVAAHNEPERHQRADAGSAQGQRPPSSNRGPDGKEEQGQRAQAQDVRQPDQPGHGG